MTFGGMTIGAIAAGFLGGAFGRRFTYQVNLLVFGLASFAAVLAPTKSWLIAARFLRDWGWVPRSSSAIRRLPSSSHLASVAGGFPSWRWFSYLACQQQPSSIQSSFLPLVGDLSSCLPVSGLSSSGTCENPCRNRHVAGIEAPIGRS